MNVNTLEKDIKQFVDAIDVRMDAPLADYTYTKVGGKADVLVFPRSYSEIEKIVAYTKENDVPLTILGNASNVIIRDGGLRGVVIILTKMNEVKVEDNKITAQSGAAIIDVSRVALDASLSGLEFACGIPGSIGGALYMNAGAYGGEVKDVLEQIVVITDTGERKVMTSEELELGYRTSVLQNNNYIAVEATFALEKGDQTAIKAKMDELTFLRESKQPLEYPSCGSVFQRPPGHFAGKLIMDAGLQLTRIGGVEVSGKHAGFMVNVDNGTASDYINLIKHVQKTVKEKFDVSLHREVRIIGDSKE
ncbi:UDP-N-acetylmuramate dehydrogenase [Terribacillus saccharophilus]|uniref:UDP-N-acetylmuramate dehydrogenase n=1 Tax=Terribacillus saccharophilus TaxID=361277 RepID=UPI0039826671